MIAGPDVVGRDVVQRDVRHVADQRAGLRPSPLRRRPGCAPARTRPACAPARPKRAGIGSNLPGQVSGLCGQASQVAACGSHSAGKR